MGVGRRAVNLSDKAKINFGITRGSEMMSILEFEKSYSKVLNEQYKQLEVLYKKILSLGKINLDGRDVTKAILFRMKAYYELQNRIKKLLKKRYSSAASDFFVEAVSFYLKAILELYDTGLEIHSERQIRPKKGAIRPDISIWRSDEVSAIIECKTQPGWRRDKWEVNFRERERKLKKEFRKARAFLVVLTSDNWPGFSPGDKRVGKQYFTLSSVWPTKIPDDTIETVIINPIEDLFKSIVKSETYSGD